MAREDVSSRCNIVEECYEYFLAFAGQGLTGREQSRSHSEVRQFLERAAEALATLADAYSETVRQENLQPAERYLAFHSVLARDAADSLAAMQLVLAQETISSQLIDNLNASIHLRALLTDLFLIDEILKPQPITVKPPSRAGL